MSEASKLPKLIGLVVGALLLAGLPFIVHDQYQLHLAQLIGIYWILIAGLNLVVGYSGQLSVGHVGLLAVGAYAFAILTGRYDVAPLLALAASGIIGGLCGLLLGLPSLRLPGFYFAMVTLAFAVIVNEQSVAQTDLTGGGVGLPVGGFPTPFASPAGLYWLVLAIAAFVTWMTWNIARFMWGRALVGVRDSEVAARSVGVSVYRVKLIVFVLSGFTAGIAGALFASLQSYITPDTFVFDLGLFFFTCIIIGGRGSIIGPFIGTIILTALPELVAPLAKLGNFFYGFLLLIVVLLTPEGFGRLFSQLTSRLKPSTSESTVVAPDPARLKAALASHRSAG
ncbi:MAG: branched-chain amino acid ABC transporter permease [Proteobacteria bacterium]|nr:branched-chain amino acid ABC transporter permease [Pseudomonadota bacterium]